jgi:hypothetical protein
MIQYSYRRQSLNRVFNPLENDSFYEFDFSRESYLHLKAAFPNKKMNQIGGIFHRGLTPIPLWWKIIKKCLQKVSYALKLVLYDTGNSNNFFQLIILWMYTGHIEIFSKVRWWKGLTICKIFVLVYSMFQGIWIIFGGIYLIFLFNPSISRIFKS